MNRERKNIKSLILEHFKDECGFQAMSRSIELIDSLTSMDDTSTLQLANAILKDFSLTHKVLKLVNTISYAQYGEVTTISRAVILLGHEKIRNLALTLRLFDCLKKYTHKVELKDLIVKSFYSGLLAKSIAGRVDLVNQEESYICAVFHSLGSILTALFMPEEYEEIRKMMDKEVLSESVASRDVLGNSYSEIAMAVAKEWNFPVKIVHSMRKVPGVKATGFLDEVSRLSALSTLANDISGILGSESMKLEKRLAIVKLIGSYRELFAPIIKDIDKIITAAVKELREYADILEMNPRSPFNLQLDKWPDHNRQQHEPAPLPYSQSAFPKGDSLLTFDDLTSRFRDPGPEAILVRGIQEVTRLLVSDHSVNDIMKIALETMYRAIKFTGPCKMLFFLKEINSPVMSIRFGFGSDMEETTKWFKIRLDEQGDTLFSIAMSKQKDLIVRDVTAADVKDIIPYWLREKLHDNVYLLVMPVISGTRPIGLLYAQGEKKGLNVLSEIILTLIQTLRDQTVLAVKQKQGQG